MGEDSNLPRASKIPKMTLHEIGLGLVHIMNILMGLAEFFESILVNQKFDCLWASTVLNPALELHNRKIEHIENY